MLFKTSVSNNIYVAKGLLYRKLTELTKARKKGEKQIKKEHKTLSKDIDRESDEIVKELESLIKMDMRKSEHDIGDKFNRILKNLQTLNKLNKAVISQNQSLIGLLKKKRRVTISI
jgi:phosphoenolpyruvate-protein kinase (PTS system EI component)